jgi:propionyl-CoA synthetase
MRSIADGEQFQIPSTIDDETIIDEIKTVLIKYEIGTFNKNNTLNK